jgi:GAF domain-containing protein
MQIAPLPDDESTRLKSLGEYQILDTEPEVSFDDLTTLAASICATPIALVSLVDAERQWFKSCIGLSDVSTPRDVAFCSHTILQPDILIVPDTALDDRFADIP